MNLNKTKIVNDMQEIINLSSEIKMDRGITEKYYDSWYAAKFEGDNATLFRRIFKDSLKIEFPVTYQMETFSGLTSAMKDELKQSISNLAAKLTQIVFPSINDKNLWDYSFGLRCRYRGFENTIYALIKSTLDKDHQSIFLSRSLTYGEIEDEPKTIEFNEGATPNKKIRKIIKKLIKPLVTPEELQEINKEYEDILTVCNRLISKTYTDTLVISIDPREYLTLSTNTYNWDSCLQLKKCYAAGAFSLMLSHNTIVAYLKGGQEWDLPSDNKKWRTLVTITDNMVFSHKNYPFQNKNLDQTIYSTLLSYTGYEFNLVEKNSFDLMDKHITYLDNITKYCYLKEEKEDVEYIDWDDIFCSECGEIIEDTAHLEDAKESERIKCCSCSDMIYASCCDQWIYREDYNTTEEMCTYCFENYDDYREEEEDMEEEEEVKNKK